MTNTIKDPSAKNSHYARLRRQFRDSKRQLPIAAKRKSIPLREHRGETLPSSPEDRIRIYGIHSVNAVLSNPKRHIYKLLATKNALKRLDNIESKNIPIEEVSPKELNHLVGADCVHQGVMVETKPLKPKSINQLSSGQLVILLDQITDPHNVGAIMRSAVAFQAHALITTNRHSPQESAVLAKSASGALDIIDHITVRNLAETLKNLQDIGYTVFGLDSEAPYSLKDSLTINKDIRKIAIVLGAEGKGLREKTRKTVDILARLDMPGAIKSLNVSNAAAITLYVAHEYLSTIKK